MSATFWLCKRVKNPGHLAFAASLAFLFACSHAPKKTPELSRLQGRSVALVDIDGPPTAKSVVETALVNQLVQRGTFNLVSKQDVDAARVKPSIDSTDARAVAREAHADYALTAKVLRFDAETHQGYSSEVIEDSLMKEETGEAKTERLYKVQTLTGNVEIRLQFTDVKTGEIRTGIAEARDEVRAESKTSAAHLPPKLRFLENISNEAFRKFFDQYN